MDGWVDGWNFLLMMDRKPVWWKGILCFVTLSITCIVTTLQFIGGKSKTGPQLRSMSYWLQDLDPAVLKVCMSSSAAARVFFAHWQTVCSARASSAQSIWSKTLTCKELVHVTDSESSSAQVIDPAGDLLPRRVTACNHFFQIKHFLHVEIDFFGAFSLYWTTHILIPSHMKNTFHFLGDLFICRFDSFCNIFCSRMMYVWVSQRWNTRLETMLAMWNIMKEHAGEGSGAYHYRVAKDVFG